MFPPNLVEACFKQVRGKVQFDQGGLEGGGSFLLSKRTRDQGWEDGPDRAMAIGMMFKGGLERRM